MISRDGKSGLIRFAPHQSCLKILFLHQPNGQEKQQWLSYPIKANDKKKPNDAIDPCLLQGDRRIRTKSTVLTDYQTIFAADMDKQKEDKGKEVDRRRARIGLID